MIYAEKFETLFMFMRKGTKKMKKLSLFLLFCCFTTGTAWGNDVEIIAPLFVYIIEEDGSGVYQKVLREAARRSGISYKEKIYPIKRALKNFSKRRGLCMYGMIDPAINMVGEENLVTSFPMGVAKLYIFTKKGTPAITSLKQLKGKRVGGTIGYEDYYKDIRKKGVRFDYVGNEKGNIKKLMAGRIDVMLGFLPDYALHLPKLSFSPNHPVAVVWDSVTCHNTEEGRRFVNQISPALKEMKNDGTLKALLGDRYMEFEYIPRFKYEYIPK